MQSLPPHTKNRQPFFPPSIAAKLEVILFVRPIEFFPDQRKTRRLGMDANLMFASGFRNNRTKRETIFRKERKKARFRTLGLVCAANDSLLDENRTVRIFPQVTSYLDLFAQFARKNGPIASSDLFFLERLLPKPTGRFVFSQKGQTARFTVQTTDQIDLIQVKTLPDCTHETRPRTVFGRMANQPTGFVECKNRIIFVNQP